MELNKVASTSKLCAWKKSWTQANPTLLLVINFWRPKKSDLVPSVSNDEVNIKIYFSRDPRRLPEFARNKFIQLKEIAPKAALLSSVSIFDDTQLDSGTDKEDEDETACIPEPLGSLFESCTINFNVRELKSYSKKVFLQYEKSYTQKHFGNLCKITRDQSLSRSWKAHRVARTTSSFAKQPFQLTNVHLQGLLLQISCSTTLLLEVKLLIMVKIQKNMPKNHFKPF